MKKTFAEREELILKLFSDNHYVPMKEKELAMFLQVAESSVEARAPEKILRLGFAVVRCDGRAVTRAEGLAGREVEIQLAEGYIKAEVKKL